MINLPNPKVTRSRSGPVSRQTATVRADRVTRATERDLQRVARFLVTATGPLRTRLRLLHAHRTALPLAFVDATGRLLPRERPCCGRYRRLVCRRAFRQAVEEALRWGEPSPRFCPAGRMLWGVPLLANDVLAGGAVTAAVPATAESRATNPPTRAPSQIRTAAEDLQALAEGLHLTNSAQLAENRRIAAQDRARAEAIHAAKRSASIDLLRLYLREEPELLAAIQRHDLPAAREVLNRVLVLIYSRGQGQGDLVRSFILELVVMVSRTVVASGANADQVIAGNYQVLASLAHAADEVTQARTVADYLERAIQAVPPAGEAPVSAQIARAVAHMRLHAGQLGLSRDETATVAGLSPCHFSTVLRQQTGQTFSALLRQFRVTKAQQLVRATQLPLREIARQCGFPNAAGFSRVFRQTLGTPPGAWRRARRQPPHRAPRRDRLGQKAGHQ